MQTSPTLSITNLASLNYNPFSGNMFNAATCDKKEDPIAYLGKPPQLITLMQTTNTQVTTNTQISQTAGNKRLILNIDGKLNIGNYDVLGSSSYVVNMNSQQPNGISAELIYNLGTRLGSYLSQSD